MSDFVKALQREATASGFSALYGSAPEAVRVQLIRDSGLDMGFRIARDQSFEGKPARHLRIFGRRSGFQNTSEIHDIAPWLTVNSQVEFPALSAATDLELVSSSANDSGAGSGVQSVGVAYRDTTTGQLSFSTAITLNGTTPVAFPINTDFVYGMFSFSVGSLGAAGGNIDLRVAGGGIIHERILPFENRSLSCRFRVPNGLTAFITNWNASAFGNATMDMRLRAGSLQGLLAVSPLAITQDAHFVSADDGFLQITPFTVVQPGGIIKGSVIPGSTAGNVGVDCGFTFFMMDITP